VQRNHSNIKLLSKIFENYKDIQAVYLFGSYVSGKTHRNSDIDLGIVPVSSKTKEKKLELLADLAKHGFCNVDVVFLDTDDIVLRFEVIRNNRLIYHKSDFDHGSFFSKIIRQYFDFLPYLEVQRQAYKERIQNG